MSEPAERRDPIALNISPQWNYRELEALLDRETLPALIVDLDVLEANIARLASIVSAAGKKLRVASKSVRIAEVLNHIIEQGSPHVRGLMCFSVAEADFLHRKGFDDLLLAYPCLQPAEMALLRELRARGAEVTAMLDCPDHVRILDEAWARLGRDASWSPLPVCIDVDMSYRPLGDRGPHLGVQRSPLRSVAAFQSLLKQLEKAPHLRLRGVMGYEAQIAGLGEANPFTPLMNPLKRLFKERSVKDVASKRGALARCLKEAGLTLSLFNGGGTGSLRTTSREPWITEVTAGSGFLQSHLFDYYRDNRNEPALCFALRVTRRPQPGVVTCQSGGFVASGECSKDKLPRPFLPQGLEIIAAEGFGEVQTPLRVPGGVELKIGSPVIFRPAKAGEIAERFNECLLKRGGQIVGRARTYRGEGYCFY